MASTLGTGFFQPQARPGGVTITQESLADEIAPFMKDYLERESALASLRSEGLRDEEGELVLDDAGQPVDEGGYRAYTGQTIAEFTPEQLAAQSGLTSLAGFETTIDPVTGERTIERTGPGISGTRFEDAEALIRGQGEEFTGDVAERFMSPFQQAVIDIEKRESQQQFEQNVLPKLQAAQIGAGSFGGSRGALLESEAFRNQQQALGDIQSKGLQSAYTTGLKAFETQKARERGEATALMGLSPAQLGQQTRELQGLERVGATQQQQTQSALDELYKEFLEEESFPDSVLDRMQGAAFGFPNLKQEVKQSPTTFGASPFQNLATNVGALGTGVGNLFGQLGGKKAKHGGVVSRREGGLVPLIRRQRGRAPEPTAGELRELGFNPINVNNPPTRRGISLEEMYKRDLPESRIRRDAKAKAITALQQQQLRDRAKRAEAADQKGRQLFDKQNNPLATLFRTLGQASNVKDFEGPQLAGIGREARVIEKERKAKEQQLATQAAARKEGLLTAGEDAEISAMERMLERGEKDTGQDIAILDKLATNTIAALKNKTSITANKLKQLALYKTNPANVNAITNQALQSTGIGAMFQDGKLTSMNKTPLDGEKLQEAQKVMAQALKDYALALRQSGGNQSAALAIAINKFSSPVPKKENPSSAPKLGDGKKENPSPVPKAKTKQIPQ
jgi:hypothetical protein